MNLATVLIGLISSVLMLAAPITLTALGGMISERSGVTNIALEGLMAMGACIAACVQVGCLAVNMPIPLAVVFSLITGAIASCILSAVHGVCAINFNADQTISGVGVNMLAEGLSLFVCQLIFHKEKTDGFAFGMPELFAGIYPSILIAVAAIVCCWFVMYRMPAGFHLRACGEHPEAAESAGINVREVRWFSVLISGALGGLAGACCVLTQSIEFTGNLINGKGYIALAAVAFGRWNPRGVFFASILFGFAQALALSANNLAFLKGIPTEIWTMLPYLITLVALIAFSGKNYAPRALGKPFVVTNS